MARSRRIARRCRSARSALGLAWRRRADARVVPARFEGVRGRRHDIEQRPAVGEHHGIAEDLLGLRRRAIPAARLPPGSAGSPPSTKRILLSAPQLPPPTGLAWSSVDRRPARHPHLHQTALGKKRDPLDCRARRTASRPRWRCREPASPPGRRGCESRFDRWPSTQRAAIRRDRKPLTGTLIVRRARARIG